MAGVDISHWKKDNSAAKWVGAESTDPHERLEQAAVQFLVEALDIGEYAETAPDDDWKWQLGELVTSYARLLMGVPPTVEVEPDDEETLQEQLARLTEGWVTTAADMDESTDWSDTDARTGDTEVTQGKIGTDSSDQALGGGSDAGSQ